MRLQNSSIHAAGMRTYVSTSLRAKRSNPAFASRHDGLLRRFAPRNDDDELFDNRIRNSRALPRRRRPREIARQNRLAHFLVMAVAGLELLVDGVHVAQASFKAVGAEHRG